MEGRRAIPAATMVLAHVDLLRSCPQQDLYRALWVLLDDLERPI